MNETLAIILELIPLAGVIMVVGNHWRQIEELMEWKRDNEKIWGDRWDDTLNRLNQANIEIRVKEEQFKQIISRLEEVRHDIAIIHERCALCANHARP